MVSFSLASMEGEADEVQSPRREAHAFPSRTGQIRKIKIMLLAGGDLIESFGEPGIWAEPDVSRPLCSPSRFRTRHSPAPLRFLQLHVILGNFGCLIVERSGSDVWAFLLSHDILYHHRFVASASFSSLTSRRSPC